ncbi:MAG: sulfotransferase [Desulfobacteraceae bacterium]|nr:sulfotransferase [Desulfobacteraceae bacterium]MBC2718607.1 sulfotransferase [Desulfobacteraceae bacterium]
MKQKVEYSNLLSRVLLRSCFERQFVIPELPPKPLEGFLKWYEDHILNVDIRDIHLYRPIFVIALPRSGSSMLQDILCTHPDIAYITNTMHLFRTCFCAAEYFRKQFNLNARGERYLQDSIEVDSGSPSEGIAFWGEWLKDDPYSLNYVEHKIEAFSSLELENIYTSICKIIWCFEGKPSRFFTKNPALLPRILLLKDMFPDAKFIHLVRDARTSANSLIKLYNLNADQLAKIRTKTRLPIYNNKVFIPYPRLPNLSENVKRYGPKDIRTTANLWNDAISFVNRHKNNLPSFYEVRYEDILSNPGEEILKIFEFCELPEIKKNNIAFSQKIGQIGIIHHKNVYGNFDIVESICRENMFKYGYL